MSGSVIQGSFRQGAADIAAASRIAQPRVAAPRPMLRSASANKTSSAVQQKTSAQMRPAEHTATLQRHANGAAFQLAPNLASFGRRGGQRLPDPVRQKMESVFDASFADVRIHLGSEAGSIGALAFTHGSNIYFAPGQYNPHTTHGQQLLGHELTHVVQQRSGRVANPFGAGIAVVRDPVLEAEADQMGMRAALAPMPVQAKLAASVGTMGRAAPHGGKTVIHSAVQRSASSGRTVVARAGTPGGLKLRPKARAIVSRAWSVQPKSSLSAGFLKFLTAPQPVRVHGVVQRRMNLAPQDFSVNRVSRRLAVRAKRLKWPRIFSDDIDQEQRFIAANLQAMIEGLESYGSFDVDDDQQLGLLYFQVLTYIKNVTMAPTGTHERLQTALSAPKPPPAVYELAFIGAGSTTAYYIDTLGPWHDHSTTLLFGETDKNPWAGQRGFSIDFINHARRQIDFPSNNTTDYPLASHERRSTKIFTKRQAFANTSCCAWPSENCIGFIFLPVR